MHSNIVRVIEEKLSKKYIKCNHVTYKRILSSQIMKDPLGLMQDSYAG